MKIQAPQNENYAATVVRVRAVHTYGRVLPVTGESVLAFCQDHSKVHGPSLDSQGWRINVLEGANA